MPHVAEKAGTLPFDELAREPAELREQLRDAGGTIVVKHNGKPACAVLAPKTYRRLMKRLDQLETFEAISQGLKDIDEGRTQPVDEAFAEIRRKHNLPVRKR